MTLEDLKIDNTRLYMEPNTWYPLLFIVDNYQINEIGVIRRIYKEGKSNIIKPFKNSAGYLQIGLFNKGKRGLYQHHRIVASAFIPNPENKPFVNHKNGLKHDNRIENLEWVTHKENMRHANDTGLMNRKHTSIPNNLTELKFNKDELCMVLPTGKKYPIKKQRGRYYIQHATGQLTVTSEVLKEKESEQFDYIFNFGWK